VPQVGLGEVGLQGAAAHIGESLAQRLSRPQMATCALVLASAALKLLTLVLCTLLLCTPRSEWLSSGGTALSSLHASVPQWLRMAEEEENEEEEEEAPLSSAISDGGISFRSHFNPGAEHILVHATRKETWWGNATAVAAHVLLALSLVSAAARRDPTPLVAAWLLFVCRLHACKLVRAKSALKKAALATALGLLLSVIAIDAAWLAQHADTPLGSAVVDVLRGDATAALALSPPQLVTLICIMGAALAKLALAPVLLKAYASVRLPASRLVAWQRRIEAEWASRCAVVLHLAFFSALLAYPLHPSPALVAAALGCWAVAQAAHGGSPLLLAAAALALCPLARYPPYCSTR